MYTHNLCFREKKNVYPCKPKCWYIRVRCLGPIRGLNYTDGCWGTRWLSGSASDSGARGRGSKPTSAVLCPGARHFTPGKYW